MNSGVMTLGTLGTWLQATSQVSTLAELQSVQVISRQIASRIETTHPALATQLRSANYHELSAGLETLNRDASLVALLESGLDEEAAHSLVDAARNLFDNTPASRDRFVPENAPAGQASTLLQYGLGRLRQVGGTESSGVALLRLAADRLADSSSRLSFLGRAAQKLVGKPQERPETSKYDYSIDRTRGRFRAEKEAPMVNTSEEGRAQFSKTRQAQLAQTEAFVSKQVSLSTAATQEAYFKLRTQVIAHNAPFRKAWDDVVLGMRNLGNMPNFKTVSDAYWQRDVAIRNHEGLKARGIGPREYDLLRGAARLKEMEADGTAADKDRLAVHGGELDYALGNIFKEYEKVSGEPETASRNTRLKELENTRIRMEIVFSALAQGNAVSEQDQTFLAEVRSRYLPYQALGLAGVDVSGIEALQVQAKAAYDLYSRQMHERHLNLAPAMLSLAVEEQRRNLEIDRLEKEWQMARYVDLLKRARVSKADQRRFEQALKDYESSADAYLTYAEKMITGDPKTRPYEENSLHRGAFISLLKLHKTVKDLLGLKDLEILTFTFKTQAQFVARGDQGIAGLEPIAEITARLSPVLDYIEKTIYNTHWIRRLAGRDWAMGQMSHYAKNVTYIGAEKFIGYLAQDIRPETMILEGAAALFPDGFAEMKTEDFAHRSAVRRALHVGQFEFSEAMGAFYQLGLGHVTILAQASVGNFPTAGPFLYGKDTKVDRSWTASQEKAASGRGNDSLPTKFLDLMKKFFQGNSVIHHILGSGALLDRESGGDQKSHEAFTREINIAMGNNVNLYESGTRDVARALASPYADLEAHPEAVHLPEYHGTGPNTGMSFRLAGKMGVPIIPVAYDLDQIYAEPSMPMPGNLATNFRSKNLRKILNSLVKSYGGFWNDTTMLRFVRPGQDDMKVAYGDVMTPESLIGTRDLSSVLRAEQMAQIEALEDEKARQKALRWQETLHNSAIANFYERAAGYMATAGIYGSEAQTMANGRSRIGLMTQPVEALRN